MKNWFIQRKLFWAEKYQTFFAKIITLTKIDWMMLRENSDYDAAEVWEQRPSDVSDNQNIPMMTFTIKKRIHT